MIKLYNSKTNQVEEFVPIKENELSMYVCGPTVYNYIHIGNARPLVFFDVVAKFFKHMGYEVKYVSNFTDVDDKIINKAVEESKSEKEITEYFMDAYLKDAKTLNADATDNRPLVTDHMNDIIEFIDEMVKRDYAYEVDGDVYFRVTKIEDYGVISNQAVDDLLVGARIEGNDKKENPLDFTLWKKTDKGIKWESPWGEGRPGWHTECVVMIDKEFDSKIDIHGGGVDLKFPHHENEVAQSKAVCDHDLANYWMHNGFVNIDGEKMSKSLNNFLLAKDLIEAYDGNIIRFAMLQTHYRQPINFSPDLLEDSKKFIERLSQTMKQASVYLQVNPTPEKPEFELTQFDSVMSNDFNTANAITGLMDDMKKLNTSIRQKNHKDINNYYGKINVILDVLGIVFDKVILSNDDIYMYDAWEKARKDKNFDLADQLRVELVNNGIL
jgi:cysteinyl-tRNA synthetase